jgi:hypothetical protein
MDVSDEEWDGEVPEFVVKRQKVAVGIPVETVFVAAPAERAVEEKKKRYDQSEDWWFNKAIKRGKKVGKTKKGVWRRVPGFPKKTILVSSKGWVQQWSKDQNAWERPKRGREKKDYYLVVTVHGISYKVHKLICRAFRGAPHSREHTTDHFAKYGDKRKERQDNRAENLDWEDASGQRNNQTRTDAPCADDRPLEVSSERARAGWDVGEWTWFQSQNKAAAAIGVSNTSVSNWLANKPCRMGWAVRWAPPAEPQADLPATGYAPAHDLAEEWVRVDDTTWVSNHGRAWQRYCKSEKWRVFTPRATEGTGGYPKITVGGKINQRFHIVLFDAHYPGVRGDRTVDHINRDPSDNRLSNLRPATTSEQNLNQTHKPLGDGNNDSKKTRIQYRRADASDDAPWERCLGAAELARRLTDATGKTYGNRSISNASNGKYNLGKVHNPHKYKDCVFYKI